MQSGYGGGGGGGGGGGRGGGVSEMQQFMIDTGAAAALFPTSAAVAGAPPFPFHPSSASSSHSPSPHQPAPSPQQFHQFHSFPVTQQLFHPNFHFFQHQQQQQQQQREQQRRLQLHQLGLEDSGPENSSPPTPQPPLPLINGGGPGFLASPVSFKLAVNDSGNGGGGGGGDGDVTETSRVTAWEREEESSIKEPFWRPLDLDFINRNNTTANNNNNKRGKEKQPVSPQNYSTKRIKENVDGGVQHEQGDISGSNYKLFSELEAIYKPGGGGSGGFGGGTSANNQQTGSGSALTGDNPVGNESIPPAAIDTQGSDTSTGEEAAQLVKFKKTRKKGRRRRQKQQLSSIATFFDGLVKQLMEHQESLHRKFIEVIERRDRDRAAREEAWRQQQVSNASREAAARANDRKLAASREATIISLLEKLTGESMDLPSRPSVETDICHHSTADKLDADNSDAAAMSPLMPMNSSRWPKVEVQALIRVRSGLETRFQEPGLKGPLWEEVSSAMSAIGYRRSAKRCKEKWENINKYFRKKKDSGKKRPQHSKTCPYFHQLDQLYSKSPSNAQSASAVTAPLLCSSAENAVTDSRLKDNSELLDAILVSTDQPSKVNSNNNNLLPEEMGSMRFDFNSNSGRDTEEQGGGNDVHGNDENEHVSRDCEDNRAQLEGEGECRDINKSREYGRTTRGKKLQIKHQRQMKEHPIANPTDEFFQR